MSYKATSCSNFTTDPASSIPALRTGPTLLRYSYQSKRYVYKWRTPSAPGCYTFFLTLDTGQVFTTNVMTTPVPKGWWRDDPDDDE